MFLKRLTLSGFKSFADATHFDFGAGVTAVVGPNGCGKSNIVDAIKWVLGEQSAKSLRGRQMLDVLFNGSGTRKSLGMAQVDLTFDNADGKLPTEATEVTVSRRLYRSGDIRRGGAPSPQDHRLKRARLEPDLLATEEVT